MLPLIGGRFKEVDSASVCYTAREIIASSLRPGLLLIFSAKERLLYDEMTEAGEKELKRLIKDTCFGMKNMWLTSVRENTVAPWCHLRPAIETFLVLHKRYS